MSKFFVDVSGEKDFVSFGGPFLQLNIKIAQKRGRLGHPEIFS
jgi:hypothetical protein